MKNKMLLYILMLVLSSFNCWAQQNKVTVNDKKKQPTKTSTQTKSAQVHNTTERKIKYYHVEETTSLKFGGYKTVYDVSKENLINNNDLGLNGIRTVTPVYADEEEPIKNEIVIKPDTLLNTKKPVAISISDEPKKKDSHAYIDIIKTYERVSDKGYVSVDMLKKMGNAYFYNDEYEKAEKCYNKLFSITTDVEPDYFYRYSIILKSMGNIQKSDEFLKKFNQLSSISSRQ